MSITLSADGSYLALVLASGRSRFHAVWLRDNARDAATLSPENGQRLITLLEQPINPVITSASLIDNQLLRLRFNGVALDYDYPLAWLNEHRYDRDRKTQQTRGWTNEHIELWNGELQSQVPTVSYHEAARNRSALGHWLAAVRRYGFATMSDLPTGPDGLLRAVELFGYVRETNYGRCFDVRAEVNPVNLAYTGLGLQAHTDNPYRDPAPTLQILACVENTVAGGESLVVDGFNAAATLQQENPQHFELLARFCARFRYVGSGNVDLSSKRPMIELNPDGELIAVRFNNRSAAPFSDIPFAQMTAYYCAYRHFAEILERAENAVTFKLQPAQLFIVDNSRVLHSRTAFSGDGRRWLRGCYPDKDGLLSTLAVIEAETAAETVSGQ